jgi:hypothetical protein
LRDRANYTLVDIFNTYSPLKLQKVPAVYKSDAQAQMKKLQTKKQKAKREGWFTFSHFHTSTNETNK